MSKQRTDNEVGRDQYNITGDGTKLNVDNRSGSKQKRQVLVQVAMGIIIGITVGYLIYLFGWN